MRALRLLPKEIRGAVKRVGWEGGWAYKIRGTTSSPPATGIQRSQETSQRRAGLCDEALEDTGQDAAGPAGRTVTGFRHFGELLSF